MTIARLEDFQPQDWSMKLSNGRQFKIRAMTIGDEAWITEHIGPIATLFANPDMSSICRIIFRLMSVEDQKQFYSIDVDEVDEVTGVCRTVKVGGVHRFAREIDAGQVNKKALIDAIVASFGMSKLVEDEENKKKQPEQV